jgi:F-type H+-transporting ATPase subunit a
MCVERIVSSDQGAPTVPDAAAPPAGEATTGTGGGRGRSRRMIVWLLVAVVVLDVVAFLVIPPYPKGQPGQRISGIADLIEANLELPAPHVIWDFAPNDPVAPGAIVFNHPSISAPIFTTWLVMLVVLGVVFMWTRGMGMIPGPRHNILEFAYESLENWAISLGGPAAARHVPLFASFFLFILFSNWSGLLPIFGKFEELRAPTSDVNVTIGLALVVFLYYNYQGFRVLGVRGYLGKFFVLSGFRQGLGAGFIDLFVGLIELMLEFIKPVTLSMRLFGNIFGGEVALGVITALTIALIPVGMLSLELLLNFVQALIFSTLMLMYTIIAIEAPHTEEHPPDDPVEALERGQEAGVAEAAAGAAH